MQGWLEICWSCGLVHVVTTAIKSCGLLSSCIQRMFPYSHPLQCLYVLFANNLWTLGKEVMSMNHLISCSLQLNKFWIYVFVVTSKICFSDECWEIYRHKDKLFRVNLILYLFQSLIVLGSTIKLMTHLVTVSRIQ